MISRFITIISLCSASTMLLAQGWNQEWAARGSQTPIALESRVDKLNPLYTPFVSMLDDFAQPSAPITTVTWWGTVSTKSQTSKPFMIAFHKTTALGRPDMTGAVYQSVVPKVRAVGEDAFGNRVYEFTAKLAMPYVSVAGSRNWIQIAEIDSQSSRKNIADFHWLLVTGTHALQAQGVDSSRTFFDVFDPMNTSAVNLAFSVR